MILVITQRNAAPSETLLPIKDAIDKNGVTVILNKKNPLWCILTPAFQGVARAKKGGGGDEVELTTDHEFVCPSTCINSN